jgi:hypothetical protein
MVRDDNGPRGVDFCAKNATFLKIRETSMLVTRTFDEFSALRMSGWVGCRRSV